MWYSMCGRFEYASKFIWIQNILFGSGAASDRIAYIADIKATLAEPTLMNPTKIQNFQSLALFIG